MATLEGPSPEPTLMGPVMPVSTLSPFAQRRRHNVLGACACLDAGLSCGAQIITDPPASASRLAQDEEPTNTIAIASGAAAGGALCLSALVGFIVFFRWRKRKQEAGDQPSSDDSATHMPTRSSAISEYSNVGGRAASDSKGANIVISAPYSNLSESGQYGSAPGVSSSDNGYSPLAISPPLGYGDIPVASSGAYDSVPVETRPYDVVPM